MIEQFKLFDLRENQDFLEFLEDKKQELILNETDTNFNIIKSEKEITDYINKSTIDITYLGFNKLKIINQDGNISNKNIKGQYFNFTYQAQNINYNFGEITYTLKYKNKLKILRIIFKTLEKKIIIYFPDISELDIENINLSGYLFFKENLNTDKTFYSKNIIYSSSLDNTCLMSYNKDKINFELLIFNKINKPPLIYFLNSPYLVFYFLDETKV